MAQEPAKYSVEQSESGGQPKLVATFAGQDFWVTNGTSTDQPAYLQEMYVLNIEQQGDFDNDGYQDALLTANAGGAASIPTYFIVSHHGRGYFSLTTAEDLSTYGGYELLPQRDGSTLIKIYQALDGVGYHERVDGFAVYRLNFGNLERMAKVVNHAQIPVLFELFSADLEHTGEQNYSFDLDGDGTIDQLNCRYWDRWGDAICELSLSAFPTATINVSGNHIGIAKSKN